MSERHPHKSALKRLGGHMAERIFGTSAEQRRWAAGGWRKMAFLPVSMAAILAVWSGFFALFWWLHVVIYPQDDGRFKVVTAGSMNVAEVLMILVPFFGAIPIAFWALNVVIWLVARTWRAVARSGATGETGFGEATMDLAGTAMVALGITLVSGTIGAVMLGHRA